MTAGVRAVVTKLLAEGRVVLPVRPGEKATRVLKWSDEVTKPTAEDFGPNDNVAERLDNVTDVDLDAPEARAAATTLLLKTPRRHGRPSLPHLSHFWFDAPGSQSEVFKDVDGSVLVEIRTGRQQYTLIPPSWVPRKDDASQLEQLTWDQDRDPARVDAEGLRCSVRAVATAALLARHWPKGSRHACAKDAAGFLVAREVAAREVEEIIRAAATAAGDEEIEDRVRAAIDTCATFKAGGKTTGGPTLEASIGKDVVKLLYKWFDADEGELILDPQDPLPGARKFVEREHSIDGRVALRHQAGVFYRYEPTASAYYERDEASVRANLYGFLEGARRRGKFGLVAYKPTLSKVANILDAVRAVCNLPTTETAPCWLQNDPGLASIDMLACKNGLLHIPTRTLRPATPDFFTLNGLDFCFEDDPPAPVEWLTFLQSVWPDDQESIDTLQEIFGYVLTPDTRFQKIGMIVGPKRSGKGTIARVMRRLVGARNSCSPTLASFGRDFGKQVLVGKTLAIISDARISGRTDTATVAETLLSVSGEDDQTVERKFLPDWNGRLAVRFLLLANELPRIGDASGALTSRFIVMVMKQSFFGKEDMTLFDRLVQELAGILNWALVGRDRLYARGHFIQPASANDMIQEFSDLSSPEAAFLTDCCEVQAGVELRQTELFDAWRRWCDSNGHKYTGTRQTFARSLRAVLPWLDHINHRTEDGRERSWIGLRLRADAAGVREPF